MKARRCQRGHPIKGTNVSWYGYRGTRAKRCRRCYNRYMRDYDRRMKRRKGRGKA